MCQPATFSHLILDKPQLSSLKSRNSNDTNLTGLLLRRLNNARTALSAGPGILEASAHLSTQDLLSSYSKQSTVRLLRTEQYSHRIPPSRGLGKHAVRQRGALRRNVKQSHDDRPAPDSSGLPDQNASEGHRPRSRQRWTETRWERETSA